LNQNIAEFGFLFNSTDSTINMPNRVHGSI
jgi:hypothetical protein